MIVAQARVKAAAAESDPMGLREALGRGTAALVALVGLGGLAAGISVPPAHARCKGR
jgi:hypothetical protein